MSSIGSPIDASILQAAQAQQVAGKARSRERATTDRRVRQEDMLELRVAGVETSDAVRKLPHNESGQADAERDAKDQPAPPEDGRPRVDVQA